MSHAPLAWFVVCFFVYILAASAFIKTAAIIVWLASWSHFLLDSIEYGIMWLWPFSKKQLALHPIIDINPDEKNFFKYYLAWLSEYAKHPTFYLEVGLILVALFVFL